MPVVITPLVRFMTTGFSELKMYLLTQSSKKEMMPEASSLFVLYLIITASVKEYLRTYGKHLVP